MKVPSVTALLSALDRDCRPCNPIDLSSFFRAEARNESDPSKAAVSAHPRRRNTFNLKPVFSAKDLCLLWKYEGRNGDWHGDLAMYAQCQHKCGHMGLCLQEAESVVAVSAR